MLPVIMSHASGIVAPVYEMKAGEVLEWQREESVVLVGVILFFSLLCQE